MKQAIIAYSGLAIIIASMIGFFFIEKESLMLTTEMGLILLLWSAFE